MSDEDYTQQDIENEDDSEVEDDLSDAGDAAEDGDDECYTYFCVECGHEQLEGDTCDHCGGEEWEFVRLDAEGRQRQQEARAQGLGDDSQPAAVGPYCQECGTGPMPLEAVFCWRCGVRLASPEEDE